MDFMEMGDVEDKNPSEVVLLNKQILSRQLYNPFEPSIIKKEAQLNEIERNIAEYDASHITLSFIDIDKELDELMQYLEEEDRYNEIIFKAAKQTSPEFYATTGDFKVPLSDTAYYKGNIGEPQFVNSLTQTSNAQIETIKSLCYGNNNPANCFGEFTSSHLLSSHSRKVCSSMGERQGTKFDESSNPIKQQSDTSITKENYKKLIVNKATIANSANKQNLGIKERWSVTEFNNTLRMKLCRITPEADGNEETNCKLGKESLLSQLKPLRVRIKRTEPLSLLSYLKPLRVRIKRTKYLTKQTTQQNHNKELLQQCKKLKVTLKNLKNCMPQISQNKNSMTSADKIFLKFKDMSRNKLKQRIKSQTNSRLDISKSTCCNPKRYGETCRYNIIKSGCCEKVDCTMDGEAKHSSVDVHIKCTFAWLGFEDLSRSQSIHEVLIKSRM